jgi:hypothetical protein
MQNLLEKKIFFKPNHWHYYLLSFFSFPSLDSGLQLHVFQVHLAFLMCKDFIEDEKFSLLLPLLGFMTIFETPEAGSLPSAAFWLQGLTLTTLNEGT